MIEFKRVVTAVDEHGRSVFHEEAPLPPTTIGLLPGAEFFLVWGGDTLPPVPVTKPEAVVAPFFPGPTGTRFGLLRIPPAGSAAGPVGGAALLAEAEEKLPGLVSHLEPDAPGMHTTQTVDYDMIVEGELWLELDDGAEVRLPAGSCIVQNGTRHAWHNRSDQPATLLFVLLGAPAA
jgi:hypothetical protein